MKKTLLFVTYGGGHATMVLPVVEYIQAHHPDIHCEILALTTARAMFESRGIKAYGFHDFLRPGIDDDALEHGERLAQSAHSNHTGIPYAETVAYMGLNYKDLVTDHGGEKAQHIYETQRGRMSFLPLHVMRRIFEKLQPDAVITTNSPRAEEAARIIAKEQNIHTIALTDLLGSYIRPLTADDICVTCEPAVEKYKDSPLVSAKRIHVTGNAAMDKTLDTENINNEAWREQHFPHIPKDKKIIVSSEYDSFYCMAEYNIYWSDEERRQNLNRLYDACVANDAHLLLRPHPSLNPALYFQWLEDKTDAGLAQEHALYPLLRMSDLLIANNSTIMLDAMHIDCPIMLMVYPNNKLLMPFDEMGFAHSANIEDAATLRETMGSALHDEALNTQHKTVFDSLFPAPPCAPKIAKVILKEWGDA